MIRRLRPLAVLSVLGVLTLLATSVGVTYAAFSATTQNSGNSFSASPDFVGLRMATGTYTGNNTDNRAISAGFAPDYVVVKADTNRVAVAKTSVNGAVDLSKPLTGATAPGANQIQSLTATGFTVGTTNTVNSNGVTYSWTAYKAASGVLSVGSYTGNGTTRSVSTGFDPEYVAIAGEGAQRAVARVSGATRTYRHDVNTGLTNGVTALGSGGFTVGAGAEVNANAVNYHYVAFNEVYGSIDVGSYTGNGVNDRSVAGVGFQPDNVLVRADDTVTGRRTQTRGGTQAVNLSVSYDAVAAITTGVKAFEADGFKLGTDGTVNANGVSYPYLATRNTE